MDVDQFSSQVMIGHCQFQHCLKYLPISINNSSWNMYQILIHVVLPT